MRISLVLAVLALHATVCRAQKATGWMRADAPAPRLPAPGGSP